MFLLQQTFSWLEPWQACDFVISPRCPLRLCVSGCNECRRVLRRSVPSSSCLFQSCPLYTPSPTDLLGNPPPLFSHKTGAFDPFGLVAPLLWRYHECPCRRASGLRSIPRSRDEFHLFLFIYDFFAAYHSSRTGDPAQRSGYLLRSRRWSRSSFC